MCMKWSNKMKNEYKRDFLVSYTDVDTRLQIDLINSICLVQNMMTEYFESNGTDNKVLKTKNNAIWVLAKTKIHFNKYPKWGEIIKGDCFTTKIKPIRVYTETQFRNENNEILFYAKQESCVIDLDSRKIRKIDTVNYPMELEIRDSIDNTTYCKLTEKFTENDKVYEQSIHSTDIDYSGHTNNVFYVRYIIDSLTRQFLDNHNITDFEIHYINKTKEGQLLEIYKKEKDGVIEFLIKEKEREIVRAILNYEKIKSTEE